MHTTPEYNEHLLHCANLLYTVDDRKYLNEEITRRNKGYINLILTKGGKDFRSFVNFTQENKYIKLNSNKIDFIIFNVLEKIQTND